MISEDFRIDGKISPNERLIYSKSSTYIKTQLSKEERIIFDKFFNGKKITVEDAKKLGSGLLYINETSNPRSDQAEDIGLMIRELEMVISKAKVTDFFKLGGYGAARNLSSKIEAELKGQKTKSIVVEFSKGKGAELQKQMAEEELAVSFSELRETSGTLNLNSDIGIQIYKLMPSLIRGAINGITVRTTESNGMKHIITVSIAKTDDGNYLLNIFGQPQLHMQVSVLK